MLDIGFPPRAKKKVKKPKSGEAGAVKRKSREGEGSAGFRRQALPACVPSLLKSEATLAIVDSGPKRHMWKQIKAMTPNYMTVDGQFLCKDSQLSVLYRADSNSIQVSLSLPHLGETLKGSDSCV
jgi:hypothetical protein